MAMKNFSENGGLIYNLFQYIVNIKQQKVQLNPNDKLTLDGLKWIVGQIKRPSGFKITNSKGQPVDPAKLYREWEQARITGKHGPTDIVISESINATQLRENETRLMPMDVFGATLQKNKSTNIGVMPELTSYKQNVVEGSLNEVTQGVEHREWADNVRDAYPGVKIIKKRTEDGRHIKSQAVLNGALVGQYNMNTGVGTFKAPKKQGVAEDWQKVNQKDKTDGMSPKAVKAYRRENPGSKLKTAVTTKPSKLKPGSKDAKRRKSFCARMSGNPGPMKDEKGRPTPKAKALKRWNCNEDIE
jgi:hypothetical protein